MREDEIQGIPCKKKHRSKLPDARPDDIQNRLARDFAADEPNTK
jgi:hypothetical protein